MLVNQHRKTLTIEELSDSEMLLNRESNPGLPRLVVRLSHDNWMIVSDVL
jgi:hypothetical protein